MIRLLSIADCVSLTNAIFGFLSITMVFIGEIRVAFSFILLAVLADGLDGIIARKTRESKIGEYLESMADMTSLGIAPAVFIYTVYYEFVSCCIYKHIYLIIALIVFLSLSIVRLASFHIMKDKKFFVGLPASSSMILLLVMAYFEIKFYYILPVIIIISLAMVSIIRFPKPGIKINIIAGVLIILTIIMEKSFHGVAPILLFIAVCIYVITGPFYLLMNKKKY
jgi:CDP-diacylglycerol--serine O-phosphatidyltransferase